MQSKLISNDNFYRQFILDVYEGTESIGVELRQVHGDKDELTTIYITEDEFDLIVAFVNEVRSKKDRK